MTTTHSTNTHHLEEILRHHIHTHRIYSNKGAIENDENPILLTSKNGHP